MYVCMYVRMHVLCECFYTIEFFVHMYWCMYARMYAREYVCIAYRFYAANRIIRRRFYTPPQLSRRSIQPSTLGFVYSRQKKEISSRKYVISKT